MELHREKSSIDTVDNTMSNMDTVWVMSYRIVDNFQLEFHSMEDRERGRMEVVKTCNRNWKGILEGFRRTMVAFGEFVVDNDDDENDLVRNLFRLNREYANLNLKDENRFDEIMILTMSFAICSSSCFDKTFIQ